MKVKLIATLIILATLAIGVLIGTLASGAMVSHRQEQIERTRTHEGFMERMHRVIEPTDEAQWEEISAILESGAARMIELRRQHSTMMRSVADSIRTELDPILTPEQRERIGKQLKFGPERKRLHRHGRGQSQEHRRERLRDTN